MKINPYIFTRKEFLDKIWKQGELDGNKITLNIGDILRLADALYGYEREEEKLEVKKLNTKYI